MGWNLSLPTITRTTDKGLTRYLDAQESDVFILSGVEDLVPVLKIDSPDGMFTIQRYRPRVEGLFAIIERWTRIGSDEIHWRSISKDNITTLYGKTTESRIADPNEPRRIFSWLICESYDDKGNAIVYEYEEENSEGIDIYQIHERNRTRESRRANRYLKRIKYGNERPKQPNEDLSLRTDWMFEVVFDYGEHHPNNPIPTDLGTWSVRHDPFSSYRAGFEIRTYRLCQRALMFHHISGGSEGTGGYEGLVRSTDFTYNYETNPEDARNPIYSFLLSVTQKGYKLNDDGGSLSPYRATSRFNAF